MKASRWSRPASRNERSTKLDQFITGGDVLGILGVAVDNRILHVQTSLGLAELRDGLAGFASFTGPRRTLQRHAAFVAIAGG